MSHSHIPVQHLIRQVEDLRARRGQRDARPAWVTNFINDIADCFDPLNDDGRVGFECHPEESAWTVTLYLGRTEIIGGPDDGVSRTADFDFDISAALKQFDTVSHMQWMARPQGWSEEGDDEQSTLMILGEVAGQPLSLIVMSVPPVERGPAFRQYPDGRRSQV